MKAMILKTPNTKLELVDLPLPIVEKNQILIKVQACGICRTDLHIIDHELTCPKLPLILGHQIVGVVAEVDENVTGIKKGDLVGVPWLGKTCNHCSFCLNAQENLCDNALFTGYTINGGFAEYCVADAEFCFLLPKNYSPTHLAPLLCAGLIGYRSYKKTKNAKNIGFYGFGSSAHILAQIAKKQNKNIYAFTKDHDTEGQKFALSLGCVWSGGSCDTPPIKLDAAIIFASDGSLVVKALKDVDKGGVVVTAGIHMSDIPNFPYALLWEERSIESVANLTRKDAVEFFKLIEEIPIETHITCFALTEANIAIDLLRQGEIKGSAIIDLSKG